MTASTSTPTRRSIDRIKTAKGRRRKEIEEALATAVEQWLDGESAEDLMEELYLEFFRKSGRG